MVYHVFTIGSAGRGGPVLGVEVAHRDALRRGRGHVLLVRGCPQRALEPRSRGRVPTILAVLDIRSAV